MSRVYAQPEDGGKRVLVSITCDGPACNAEIKPHPEIAKSGWMKYGTRTSNSDIVEMGLCPACVSKAGTR